LGLLDLMQQGQVAVFGDTIGITDDLAKLITFVRTESATLGITDVMTRAAVLTRTQADTIGITDAIIRVAVALRTINDTEGLTDERSVSHVVSGLVKAAWAFVIMRQTQN